jgi:hypothetical protein
MKKLAILVFACVVVSRDATAGNNYYVSLTGSDSRSCAEAQSLSTPRRTIRGGMTCLASGDTLLVRAGTYAETLSNPTLASGSSGAYTRVANYNGETVWLKPPAPNFGVYLGNHQYVEFDGINIDGTNATSSATQIVGIKISGGTSGGGGAHHIRYKNAELRMGRWDATFYEGNHAFGIDVADEHQTGIGFNEFTNLTIHGSGGSNFAYGIYVHTSDNVIDGCHIYDVGHSGIQMYNEYPGNPRASRNVIKNCRIHDIVQSGNGQRIGIQIVADDTLLMNNVIYRLNANFSGDDGTAISVRGNGNKIINNTLTENGTRTMDLATTNAEVKNNIGYRNTVDGISDYGSSATVAVANLFGVNAGFVNAAAGDFRLQSNSPAVDSGTTVAIVQTDIVGTQRPSGSGYDIGAFEYGDASASSATGPPPPTGLRIVQ